MWTVYNSSQIIRSLVTNESEFETIKIGARAIERKVSVFAYYVDNLVSIILDTFVSGPHLEWSLRTKQE